MVLNERVSPAGAPGALVGGASASRAQAPPTPRWLRPQPSSPPPPTPPTVPLLSLIFQPPVPLLALILVLILFHRTTPPPDSLCTSSAIATKPLCTLFLPISSFAFHSHHHTHSFTYYLSSSKTHAACHHPTHRNYVTLASTFTLSLASPIPFLLLRSSLFPSTNILRTASSSPPGTVLFHHLPQSSAAPHYNHHT